VRLESLGLTLKTNPTTFATLTVPLLELPAFVLLLLLLLWILTPDPRYSVTALSKCPPYSRQACGPHFDPRHVSLKKNGSKQLHPPHKRLWCRLRNRQSVRPGSRTEDTPGYITRNNLIRVLYYVREKVCSRVPSGRIACYTLSVDGR
jgi:hypothetical protein